MNEELIRFAQRAVQTRSFSDEEGDMARLVEAEMKKLGYDEVIIDKTGNVIGRMGRGKTVLQFDSHMDTVRADDADEWTYPPFEGRIVDGWLWGRGSVDMKSSLCASVYGAALARDKGWLEGKTVYVTPFGTLARYLHELHPAATELQAEYDVFDVDHPNDDLGRYYFEAIWYEED